MSSLNSANFPQQLISKEIIRKINHLLVSITVIVIVDLSDTFLKSSNDRVESAHSILVPFAPFVTLIKRKDGIITGLGEREGLNQSAFVTRRVVLKKLKLTS